jgi:hypothetical protein
VVVYINWARRELNLKIVYYGPPLSGKTTNLVKVYERADPKTRGELISLATEEDRTLYFDFLRVNLRKVNGLTPRIHLYTVPGQAYYEASRKMVLRGADGVVFVADSASERVDENVESWHNMRSHLSSFPQPTGGLPIVVQFNKQDLPNALPGTTLRYILQLNGYPGIEAVALEGHGVFDTLKTILHDVMSRVQEESGQA